MKRSVLMLFGLISLFVISGCSTTGASSASPLENRGQALEARVGVLEKGASTAPFGSETNSDILKKETQSSITAETMTKTQVQEALKNAGYYDGGLDGKFGPKTKEAIKKFQEAVGLKMDGIAGPQTKEKLLKYVP